MININITLPSRNFRKTFFYRNLLKIEEETSEVLQLEHSFIRC